MGARCVQNLDDSRSNAIRMNFHISLRSSSLWEPRHPLLKVLDHFVFRTVIDYLSISVCTLFLHHHVSLSFERKEMNRKPADFELQSQPAELIGVTR